MNKNLVGVIGFLLILAGATLPFLRFQQSSGDQLPMLVGLVTFATGVAVLFRAEQIEAMPMVGVLHRFAGDLLAY